MPRIHENHKLSDRERQVIELAGQGLTDHQIAIELGISESTVTTYWDRIRLKYGAHHRTELVLRVMREKCEQTLASMRDEIARLKTKLEQAEGPMILEMVEGVDEAIIVIDQEERIRFANPSAAKLFGCEQGDLDGALHSVLVPEELRDKHEQGVQKYLASPSRHEMGDHVLTLARHRSGRSFPIHAVLTPLHTPDGTLVMCSIRDGTEPRQYVDSPPAK